MKKEVEVREFRETELEQIPSVLIVCWSHNRRGGRVVDLLLVIGFVFTHRSPGSNFKEPPETFRYLFLII